MPLPQASPPSVVSGGLPGAMVIAMIRRLLIASLVAAFVYPVFMTSSRGYCAGGFDGDGGFIDSSGRAVDQAPRCVQLALGPSPLVYVAIALVVVLALGRVTKASDELTALRTLNRAAIAVLALVPVAIIVSQVWFFLVPLDEFAAGSGSIISPFPFGLINVATAPMTTP